MPDCSLSSIFTLFVSVKLMSDAPGKAGQALANRTPRGAGFDVSD